MLDTPILFVIFNRLGTAKEVFKQIQKVKPKQLFIAADGPRASKIGESDKCEQVRDFVLTNINWECNVKTLFRKENLGSGPAVYEAINWFFSQVDRGIILEDDCLPENSFFEYADAVLRKYEANNSIMHVSGSNSQCGIQRGSASYYFSRIPATWGWATWKRAWEKYSFDFYQNSDSEILDTLNQNFEYESDSLYFFNEIQLTKDKVISAWDYQWFYCLLKYKGICITPQYNLITNLGFNSEGTHTFQAPYWYKYLVTKSVSPLSFADEILINSAADKFYLDLTMGRRTLKGSYMKFKHNIKNLLFSA